MTENLEIVNDKIGQEIRVGSIVAMPNAKTELKIGRVKKISSKTILCEDVNRTSSQSRKRHTEVICLDEMEATVMYLMTRNL